MQRKKIIDGVSVVALLGLALWALHLIRCTPEPVTPNPDPSCVGACSQLEILECEEALPSPGGVPCAEWCGHYHAVGYMRPWAECVAASTTIKDVRSCGLECNP